jgi:hypothetical protein
MNTVLVGEMTGSTKAHVCSSSVAGFVKTMPIVVTGEYGTLQQGCMLDNVTVSMKQWHGICVAGTEDGCCGQCAH